MSAAQATTWVQQFGLEERRAPEFIRDRAAISSAAKLLPQANALRRAWDEMGLDGILCVENVPVAYFKELARPNQEIARKLQRQLWNQSLSPLLVIITPTEVQVYSGLALPAENKEDVTSDNRLVTVIDRVADVLEMRQFIRDLELGEVFRRYAPAFDPDLRVDRYLLENLKAAREQLLAVASPEVDIKVIHALLGRIVFTCYLTDREIIQSNYFAEAGATGCSNLAELLDKNAPATARQKLYKLFSELQQDFNGDIFDDDLAAESQLINDEQITVLTRLLKGEKLTTGQLSLGFWAYDFSIVPIETISAIYEQFLGAEDEQDQQESGAYYTPRFLAELVLDQILEAGQPLLGKRFLDPACGSGIFLVGLFNRLAEEWNRQAGRTKNLRRAEELTKIITQSLFGIDRNETACRIAAFSLYLALLDHLSPRDIQELQAHGKLLPKLVVYRRKPNSEDAGRNIIHGDFFEDQLPLFTDQTDLPSQGFDYIVGNPPWVRVTNKKSFVQLWSKARDFEIPQGQAACAFVLKAPEHLRTDGRICFVLPISILLNHQDKSLRFQHHWFSNYSIEQIMNLADLRLYLFASAVRPAAIIKYSKAAPNLKEDVIEYLTPKTNVESLRADILTIATDDYVEVELRSLLVTLGSHLAPLVWKQTFWGTSRDNKFLHRLTDLEGLGDRTGNKYHEKERWTIGEGFNRFGQGKSIDRPILHEIPFLDIKNLTRYVIPRSASEKEPVAYDPRRLGKEAIYRTPHILFPRGNAGTGERLKVAYGAYDCSFMHSLCGLHAPQKHEDQLRALTCALASPLALYFFFHTSASWGIERPYISVTDYERFPFPAPELPEQKEALRELAQLHRSLEEDFEESFIKGNWRIQQESENFDELVYAYYGVDAWERALIEDTVKIWIPSATPRRSSAIPAIDPASATNREEYLKLLLEVLNTWSRSSGKKLSGNVIGSPTTALALVRLKREATTDQTEPETTSSAELERALKRVKALLPNSSGSIRQLRNLKVFVGDELYLVKPLIRRYWTRTAALNDADDIAAAILSASQEKVYATQAGNR